MPGEQGLRVDEASTFDRQKGDMVRMVLLLMLLPGLAGCAVVFPPPDPDPTRVVTCGHLVALAGAVVDGRQAGQSREEQRQLVSRGSPIPNTHLGYVESVYDWPRPTTARGWADLRARTAAAAQLNCLNYPVAVLGGPVSPPVLP